MTEAIASVCDETDEVRKPPFFETEAVIDAEDGKGDGAYSLFGIWTAEEFLAELARVMKHPVKSMLTSGDKEVGHCLTIRIYHNEAG